MAEIKKYSRMTEDLMVYGGDTTKTPTTMQNMMAFMKQEADSVGDLIDGLLWQPNTPYELKAVIHSPNLPAGRVAVCTSAGQSGNNEPAWNENVKSYSDGTLSWELKNAAGGDVGAGIAVGMIIPYANNAEIPEGFLLCNGASVLRATYPDLFNAIGTTFGAEDNAHFNLPDLRERFIEGGDSLGGYKEAGLPNIEGEFQSRGHARNQDYNGALTGGSGAFEHRRREGAYGDNGVAEGSVGSTNDKMLFNASHSNPIYGNSDTVQPKSITVRYIIKAFGGLDLEQEDIQVTQIMNEINRIDAKLNDLGISRAIDVVVEYGGDENLWYRKYASGWLEQGGMYYQSSATRELNHIFTLLKPFRNNLYTVSVTAGDERAMDNAWSFSTGSNCLSNTSFLAHVYGIGSGDVAKRINFYACGMGG